MPRRNRKGQFVKGGGHRRRSAPRRSSSRAIVRRSHASPAPRRRRRSGGGMGNLSLRSLAPPLIAGAVLGRIVKQSGTSGVGAQLIEIAKKVPGQKTFGTAPALGAIALAVDRFVYRHRYLRLVGVAGLIIGAYDAGGTKDLKWVGGVGDDDDGMAVGRR